MPLVASTTVPTGTDAVASSATNVSLPGTRTRMVPADAAATTDVPWTGAGSAAAGGDSGSGAGSPGDGSVGAGVGSAGAGLPGTGSPAVVKVRIGP